MTDDFRVYVYKEGYLRTSSDKFSLADKNVTVHLTNQSMQVKEDLYSVYEDGNTLTYKDLQEYLIKTYKQRDLRLEEFFSPRVHDLIIDSCLSNKRTMNP